MNSDFFSIESKKKTLKTEINMEHIHCLNISLLNSIKINWITDAENFNEYEVLLALCTRNRYKVFDFTQAHRLTDFIQNYFNTIHLAIIVFCLILFEIFINPFTRSSLSSLISSLTSIHSFLIPLSTYDVICNRWGDIDSPEYVL